MNKNFKFKWMPDRAAYPIIAIMRRRRKTGEINGIAALADMSRDMECVRGVEIGTYLGNSAKIWCRANPKLRLTCVDPYTAYGGRPRQATQDECYATATRELKEYRATIRRESSMDVVRTVQNASLDFLFIDGDHRFDAAMMDLIRWVPKVRRGGIVAMHDYTSLQGPGVMLAVNAYTTCHRISPWYVTMDYSPTVFWEKGAEAVP